MKSLEGKDVMSVISFLDDNVNKSYIDIYIETPLSKVSYNLIPAPMMSRCVNISGPIKWHYATL